MRRVPGVMLWVAFAAHSNSQYTERIVKGLIAYDSFTFFDIPDNSTGAVGHLVTTSSGALCFKTDLVLVQLLNKVSKQRIFNQWLGYLNACAIGTGLTNCPTAVINCDDSSFIDIPGWVFERYSLWLSVIESRFPDPEIIEKLGSTLINSFPLLGPWISNFTCAMDHFPWSNSGTTLLSLATDLILEAYLGLLHQIHCPSSAFQPLAISNISSLIIPISDPNLSDPFPSCDHMSRRSLESFLLHEVSFDHNIWVLEAPMLPDICSTRPYSNVSSQFTFLSPTVQYNDSSGQIILPGSVNPALIAASLLTSTNITCPEYRGNSAPCSIKDMWSCDSVEGCYIDWDNLACADTPPGYYSTSMSDIIACHSIPSDQFYVGKAWTNPVCPSKCSDSSYYMQNGTCVPIRQQGVYAGTCDDDNSLHECISSEYRSLSPFIEFPHIGACAGAFWKYLVVRDVYWDGNGLSVWVKIQADNVGSTTTMFGVVDGWSLASVPESDGRFRLQVLTVDRTIYSASSGTVLADIWFHILLVGTKIYLDGTDSELTLPWGTRSSNGSQVLFLGSAATMSSIYMFQPSMIMIPETIDFSSLGSAVYRTVASPTDANKTVIGDCDIDGDPTTTYCQGPTLRFNIPESTSTTTQIVPETGTTNPITSMDASLEFTSFSQTSGSLLYQASTETIAAEILQTTTEQLYSTTDPLGEWKDETHKQVTDTPSTEPTLGASTTTTGTADTTSTPDHDLLHATYTTDKSISSDTSKVPSDVETLPTTENVFEYSSTGSTSFYETTVVSTDEVLTTAEAPQDEIYTSTTELTSTSSHETTKLSSPLSTASFSSTGSISTESTTTMSPETTVSSTESTNSIISESSVAVVSASSSPEWLAGTSTGSPMHEHDGMSPITEGTDQSTKFKETPDSTESSWIIPSIFVGSLVGLASVIGTTVTIINRRRMTHQIITTI